MKNTIEKFSLLSELLADEESNALKECKLFKSIPPTNSSDFRGVKKSYLDSRQFNSWLLNDIGNYRKRYNVYYGGGGSGKSYGASQKIVLKASLNKRKVLVVRKVGATLKHSIYTVIKSILDSSNIKYSENKSDMTLTLFNGSVFLFKGIDDPEKIKSIADITDIVIEEASELTEDDFTQLNIRLRPLKAKYPQIYLMFNPVSKVNWVYKHWFLNESKDAEIIHTTYQNNKFLTTEYRKTLEKLKDTNPAYYKIYCLGEFATLDRLVFPIIEKRLVPEVEVNKLKFFCGMDFGYVNDETAIISGRIDKRNKVIYITGEYFKKGMTNDVIAEVIKGLGLQKEIITADSAEQKSIAELKKLGINRIRPAQKGKDSIIHGLQWLSQYKIIVDERCQKIIEEFENYTWKKDKKTGEYINEPIDSYNHGIDALRYGLEQEMKGLSISFLK